MLIVREMTELLVLDMVEKRLVTDHITLTVGYDHTGVPEDYDGKFETDHYGRRVPKQAHGSMNLGKFTSSTKKIVSAMVQLYSQIVDKQLQVRRMYTPGVYADVLADFLLTTDNMPAVYSDGAIVKSESGSDEDFANFLSNIATVSVNGTEYKASGKGSVKIINEDGTINYEEASKDANVFDGSGDYSIVVKSTGYNNTLEFTTALDYIPGDISGNGAIDLYDAIEICKSIMGMRTFTEAEKNIADYNCDGEVNLYDAIGIAKEIMNNLR